MEQHINSNANRQLINKALFVSWAVLLSEFNNKAIQTHNAFESFALPLANKVTSEKELFMFLTYSTNSKVNIQAAFKAAEELIKANLKQ